MKQKNKNQEKQNLKNSNISLITDGYKDIFSNFDPRHYSERALSVDFLDEAKRASRDKFSGKIELQLMIPTKKRNLKEETTIKKRLLEHFKKHREITKKESVKILKQGLFFLIIGLILMLIATFILFEREETAMIHFLIILFEPGSWFLFWEGLDLIIFESKKNNLEKIFYEKMSKCEIRFMSY